MIELLSIDLSNYCSKQCSFCYNHSTRMGNTMWKPEEVIAFASDCIQHGVKAISLGGGEPFEYDGIWQVIQALYPLCYLSITTNGLPLLDGEVSDKLRHIKPDKIHITIHQPHIAAEVERVIAQLQMLTSLDIKPGVNLLVGKDKLSAAHTVYQQLLTVLSPDQIILVPQRYSNTPSAKELAAVADNKAFQSPSCLLGCKRPTNFVSISWDKKVNSCSYAPGKQPLESLTFDGMVQALNNVNWKNCIEL